MNAFYVQYPGELFPIFGVSSMEEAQKYADHVIESSESVLMNPNTGSVDFESAWDSLDGLIEVKFKDCWTAA